MLCDDVSRSVSCTLMMPALTRSPASGSCASAELHAQQASNRSADFRCCQESERYAAQWRTLPAHRAAESQ